MVEVTGQVEVKFGSGESKRTVSREVKYSKLETADDVLGLLNDPKTLAELLGDVNYARNLGARSKVRQAIMSTEAGPDKAIEKAIKDMVKARAAVGKPITEEQAKQMLGV